MKQLNFPARILSAKEKKSISGGAAAVGTVWNCYSSALSTTVNLCRPTVEGNPNGDHGDCILSNCYSVTGCASPYTHFCPW